MFRKSPDGDYDDLVITARGFDLGGEGAYAYAAHALDADNDVLTYSLVNAPPGAAIDAQSGALSFQAAIGQYDFVVAADDGHGGDVVPRGSAAHG